jgi:UDP-N-acetylmuramoyl-L-alanyl-D-glutamate--2,6-diaminopimelate ligase
MGADIESVKKALSRVKVIGRIEPVEHPLLRAPVIIDYAHNAMSLESLFTAVRAYNPKRIICVFGCGGNRSKLRRYEMGEISGRYADLSIITADNSRFEELDDIISDILVGMGKTQGKYEIVKDRKDAIYRAIELSQEGDIVLLAGKGQETYQILASGKIHYDEREVVAQILSEKVGENK